jgi:hypothetical protein
MALNTPVTTPAEKLLLKKLSAAFPLAALLGSLTFGTTAASGATSALSTNAPAAKSDRLATLEMKAKMRAARDAFERNPENKFLSVNLITNLASSPSVPLEIRNALKNPEVVKAIIASGHDNKVFQKHLTNGSDPISKEVIRFTQHALNVWNSDWMKYNVDQGEGLARFAREQVQRFSSTNELERWDEGVAINSADERWQSNRVVVAKAAVQPGGKRAPLALDGIVGKLTRTQLHHAILDMNGQWRLSGEIVEPRGTNELAKATLNTSPAIVMLHLCDTISRQDSALGRAVEEQGLMRQIADIRSGKK